MNSFVNRKAGLLLTALVLIALSGSTAAGAGQGKRGAEDRLQGLLADLSKYDYGTDRDACLAVSDYLVTLGNRKALVRAETQLAVFLDSDAPLAAKDFVCGELAVIGSKESVPVLSRLLVQPASSDMARRALEQIPGEAASQALRRALQLTGGRNRIGIINSLGVRRDLKSVNLLIPFLDPQDTIQPAAAALARIGDNQAIEALFKRKTTAVDTRRMILQAALLDIADRRLQEGRNQEAFLIYRDMTFRQEPSGIRVAGYTGVAKAMGLAAIPLLISLVKEDEPEIQEVAIRLLAESPVPAITEKLLQLLPGLTPPCKARLLLALGERGDKAAGPAVLAAAQGESEVVREAALVALGRLGDATSVGLLARTAGESTGVLQDAARNSLYRMPGRDVDTAIIEALREAVPPSKLELIRAVGERGITTASSILVKALEEPDEAARRGALRALRDVGGESEVEALIGFLVGNLAESEKTEAERTLASILRRGSGRGLARVVSRYQVTSDSVACQSFLAVMGSVGSAEALPTLRAALKEGEPGVCRAAILALGEWPDSVPIPELLTVAAETREASLHILAVRSFLKLLSLPSERPGAESVRLVAEALKIAREVEVKKSVLGALPRFVCTEALELAAATAQDATLKAEAEQAIARIKAALAFRE